MCVLYALFYLPPCSIDIVGKPLLEKSKKVSSNFVVFVQDY
jgi:hypothetical protein